MRLLKVNPELPGRVGNRASICTAGAAIPRNDSGHQRWSQQQEIARRLHVTEGTVKTHVHKILQKVRVQNRTALAARYRAMRQANGHAHEFVDAQPGQPGEAIKRVRSVA